MGRPQTEYRQEYGVAVAAGVASSVQASEAADPSTVVINTGGGTSTVGMIFTIVSTVLVMQVIKCSMARLWDRHVVLPEVPCDEFDEEEGEERCKATQTWSEPCEPASSSFAPYPDSTVYVATSRGAKCHYSETCRWLKCAVSVKTYDVCSYCAADKKNEG